MGNQNDITAESVELSVKDGQAFIEQATPLTRLHYFDGKFLKADALAQEQAYHRTQVQLANLAGGWGVVHGLGVSLTGDQLNVGGGLAITSAGHFVLTVGDVQAKIADLLKVAAPTPALTGNAELGPCNDNAKNKGVTETAAMGLYEITVGPIEGLCGNEAVYGALCESACVSDSRHPYWREGLVLRLRPITLKLPVSTKVPFSTTHLRNRLASAYFALEPGSTSPALSASGLASGVWCQPASLYGRDEVVIGLLAREGGLNRVLDAWSGRRERMEAQARGYWQGRMAMRPWNVYLAQILQFQCQLSGVFDDTSVVITVPDKCDDIRAALDQTRQEIAALHKRYADSASKLVEAFGSKPTKDQAQQLADEVKLSYAELFDLSEKLSGVEAGQGALPKNRLLLDSGFVQLPPAGYLPVQPGKTGLSEQLQRIFGEGVRLHYRAARADVLPHLLEEAQHMERISLTQGIDHPDALEDVEIFVPDGQTMDAKAQTPGDWWSLDMRLPALFLLVLLLPDDTNSLTGSPLEALARRLTVLIDSSLGDHLGLIEGLARTEATREDGSLGLALAGATRLDSSPLSFFKAGNTLLSGMNQLDSRGELASAHAEDQDDLATYLSADIGTNPFAMSIGEETEIKLELRDDDRPATGTSESLDLRMSGTLSVQSNRVDAQGKTFLSIEIDVVFSGITYTDGKPKTHPKEGGTSRLIRRLDLVLQERAGGGTLWLQQPTSGSRPSILHLDWDTATRSASLTLEEPQHLKMLAPASLALKSADAMIAVPAPPPTTPPAPTPAPPSPPPPPDPAPTTLELIKAQGLPEAPQPASPVGAQALNSLVRLSTATQDSAFLARARRRLFPALQAPLRQDITAVLDWVLFRRRRPTFCDPVCAAPVPPQVEAFQIWHMQLDNADQLKTLQTALDQADAAALAQFEFKPVGVLRYRDDNTEPEESAAKVLAMWQQARPGPQVLLARDWQTTPMAGQGWPNHFRLQALLSQISALTQPPKPGDGVIATLPKLPSTLGQGALDGGMLVVTGGAVAATAKHRVVFMTLSMWADLEPSFKRKPDEGWTALLNMLKGTSLPFADLTVDISGNAPTPQAIKSLADTGTDFQTKVIAGQTPGGHTYARDAVRIDGSVIGQGEDPAARHQAVLLAAAATDIAQFKLAKIDDLGDGAHVASFIVLREITGQ